MLQHLEYGIGTPSSVAPFRHPEDVQPNEQLNRRNRNLPPRVSSSATRDSGSSRGRGGRGMSQGGWTQYAVRGKRGGGSQPNRGGHSSSRNGPVLEHWSVAESRRSQGGVQLDPTMPFGVGAVSTCSSPSSSSRSGNVGDGSRLPTGWHAEEGTVPAKRRYSPTPQVSLSQTSATPPASEGSSYIEKSRHWMLRSRSPTPKLPPSPLKRRKYSDDGTHMLPPSMPLPGRHQRKSFIMQQPVDVQQRPITPDIIVVDIKAEPRSPTPPLPQPKLVTESCEFYPLPESCQKSNPDYRENRKRFFQEKNSHLISLGLKKTKVFYRYVLDPLLSFWLLIFVPRDDGLVIEWYVYRILHHQI
ncbi:hypothetical protein M413DRAFT_244522 [Hebeloma cylindrosporum]|uniref:Uncharacterized protein n=1 Tax=Hebeloma cylindrosporum TaxID=76867 RepID=A0A0C2YBB6_HEBCY|nr:hypothetical protein M413DRAFT_244522 [Hebeloma cylindrosporum h7]